MADRIIYPEWRDFHRHTNYPFSDSASMTNGTDTIPTDLFVDARLYPPGAGADMYLSAIHVAADLVTVVVSDNSGQVGSGTFTPASPPESLGLLSADAYPVGVLVALPYVLQQLGAWELGEHVFSPSQTSFDAAVCIPQPQRGVIGFRIPSGAWFSGKVFLVGERGVHFTVDSGSIRMDVVGDALFKRRAANEQGITFETPRYLKSINTLGPDNHGDYKLTVGTLSVAVPAPALRISPIAGGLRLDVPGLRG